MLDTAVLSKELYHAINRRLNNRPKLLSENDMKRLDWEKNEASYKPYYLDSSDVATFNSALKLYNTTYHTNEKELPLYFTSYGFDTVTPDSSLKLQKMDNGKYILYKDDEMLKSDYAKSIIKDTSTYYHKHMAKAIPTSTYREKGNQYPFNEELEAEEKYANSNALRIRNEAFKEKAKKKSLKHSYFDTLEESKSIPMTEDEYLAHHGILGMKWGIRRFQNEDGTLTPRGRKRYLTTYVDVDDKGNTKIAAVGDADARRRDLEKQNKKDARSELMKNPAFRMGSILGTGGAATAASIGVLGGLSMANPIVTAAGVTGSGILGGLGFGIGSHIGKKETGLNEPDIWNAKNLKKYDINTSNLGYDIKWLKTSDLAKFKNDLHRRGLVDSIYNDNATVNLNTKKNNNSGNKKP